MVIQSWKSKVYWRFFLPVTIISIFSILVPLRAQDAVTETDADSQSESEETLSESSFDSGVNDRLFRDEIYQERIESFLDINLGAFHLNPRLDFGTGFDDNVFFVNQSSQRKADGFVQTSPSVRLLLGRPDELGQEQIPNQLEFLYNYFRRDYWDFTEINAENHTLRLRSRLNFGRLQIKGIDRLDVKSDLITRGITQGATDLDFIPQDIANQNVEDRYNIENIYRATLDFSDRTAVYLEGLHRSFLFKDGSRFLDSNILKGLSGYEFALTDQTRLFGEIYYGQIANNPNRPTQIKGPHADFLGGFVGIRGDITSRISGTIKAGYESRWFGDRSVPGYDSPVASVGLQYTPLDRTFINLNLDRALLLSNQLNNQGVIRDQIRLSLTQFLGPSEKWRANLGFSYQNEDFQSNSTIFQTYLVTAGVDYQIQEWLSANLGYAFEKFEPSGAAIQPYRVNRVNIGVSLGY